MPRLALRTLALALIALVATDLAVRLYKGPARSVREAAESARPQATEAAESSAVSVALPAPAAAPAPGPVPAVASAGSAPPPGVATASDRLARLAMRQRIREEAPFVYLDSLIQTSDSILRRWADRPAPLSVAIVEGFPREYEPRMGAHVRRAVQAWDGVVRGLALREATDTALADVVVRWIDRFDIDRAGQTDVVWDRIGRVQRAFVTLAVRDHQGRFLGDEALSAVAMHEIGHALGLPHSPEPGDIMFPATHVATPSERDRRTLRLLYELPVGSVRDEPPTR